MTDNSSSSGFQFCFFAPTRRHSGSGEVYPQPPATLRVVLVSSRSATTQSGLRYEAWCDIEQDCADCDCACFTDEE